MKLIINNSHDPNYNLALEEYVLKNYMDDDYVILWQNDNTIVIGRYQNTMEEINAEYVKEHNIHVVRRNTGGGAVYHDLGNINFSILSDVGEKSTLTMERFTAPIVEILKELGVQAEVSGRNDITVEGRKVSGNAQRIYKNRILHHGTLLFHSNPEVVQSALKVKPEKFQSKSVKSVRSRIGNIKDFLAMDISVEAFIEKLQDMFFKDGEKEILSLTENDFKAIEELQKEKYETWEWVYGKSPEFNFRNLKKYPGGFLEVLMDIKDGIIQSFNVYGDFLSLKEIDEVTDGLIGCKYDYDAVKAILMQCTLEDYFGSITLEEILDCMFYL